jgi:hypothetical protein
VNSLPQSFDLSSYEENQEMIEEEIKDAMQLLERALLGENQNEDDMDVEVRSGILKVKFKNMGSVVNVEKDENCLKDVKYNQPIYNLPPLLPVPNILEVMKSIVYFFF